MSGRELYVVFRPDAGVLAALPVRHVRETMRPLPTEPLAGAPTFVVGAAIVRGKAVPVLDAAKLMSGKPDTMARWIAIEIGARTAILAVHEVVGVQTLTITAEPAPLLKSAARATIDELASLDGELLAVLRAGRLLDLADEREPHAR